MLENEVSPHVVFAFVVEPVAEVKGVALKIKHSPGPNASYGLEQLEHHFVMPRAYAEDLRTALDAVLGSMPSTQLNA